jgi:hypothetical protein
MRKFGHDEPQRETANATSEFLGRNAAGLARQEPMAAQAGCRRVERLGVHMQSVGKWRTLSLAQTNPKAVSFFAGSGLPFLLLKNFSLSLLRVSTLASRHTATKGSTSNLTVCQEFSLVAGSPLRLSKRWRGIMMNKFTVAVVGAMLVANPVVFGEQSGRKSDTTTPPKQIHSKPPATRHVSRPAATAVKRAAKTHDKKIGKQTSTRTNVNFRPARPSTSGGNRVNAAAKKHDAAYNSKEKAKQKLLQNPLPWTPKPQDGKCSVPVVGGVMDRSKYIAPACQQHDRKYAKNNGTAWSWFGTAWRSITGQKAKGPVDKANRKVVSDTVNGIRKHAEDIRK